MSQETLFAWTSPDPADAPYPQYVNLRKVENDYVLTVREPKMAQGYSGVTASIRFSRDQLRELFEGVQREVVQ